MRAAAQSGQAVRALVRAVTAVHLLALLSAPKVAHGARARRFALRAAAELR